MRKIVEYSKTHTIQETADHFKVAKSTICRHRKRLGVGRPDRTNDKRMAVEECRAGAGLWETARKYHIHEATLSELLEEPEWVTIGKPSMAPYMEIFL